MGKIRALFLKGASCQGSLKGPRVGCGTVYIGTLSAAHSIQKALKISKLAWNLAHKTPKSFCALHALIGADLGSKYSDNFLFLSKGPQVLEAFAREPQFIYGWERLG